MIPERYRKLRNKRYSSTMSHRRPRKTLKKTKLMSIRHRASQRSMMNADKATSNLSSPNRCQIKDFNLFVYT